MSCIYMSCNFMSCIFSQLTMGRVMLFYVVQGRMQRGFKGSWPTNISLPTRMLKLVLQNSRKLHILKLKIHSFSEEETHREGALPMCLAYGDRTRPPQITLSLAFCSKILTLVYTRLIGIFRSLVAEAV